MNLFIILNRNFIKKNIMKKNWKLRQFWNHNINPISGYVVKRSDDDTDSLKAEKKKYYVPEGRIQQ